MKTAVIDPGGGMKGVFCAGVTDGLLDAGIFFDLYAGVSAGSANLASYACGQRGRTRTFYVDYAMRPEYMSLKNFLEKNSYFDFDYIFGTLTNQDGEYPLDYPAYAASRSEFLYVATNALTGRPMYFHKSAVGQDAYEVFKASCSIPWLCSVRSIRHLPAVDGTLSDPLPIEKVLEAGADRIVLILPGELHLEKDGMMNAAISHLLQISRRTHRLPGLAAAMKNRPEAYNRSIARIRQLEKEGRLLVVSPDSTHGVTPLSRSQNALEALYEEGLQQAAVIQQFLEKPTEDSPASAGEPLSESRTKDDHLLSEPLPPFYRRWHGHLNPSKARRTKFQRKNQQQKQR